jgi:SAM-dependent methyltransferase
LGAAPKKDYLAGFLRDYYPLHFFALYRAHELYSAEPFAERLESPVLDLGCGDGIVAASLFEAPLDYGIDPSGPAAEAARKSGVYRTVFTGDAHAIPLGEGTLGGIFSNCVFEHIPDLPGLIAEMARVLREGGRVVATCLSPGFYELNPLHRFLDRPGLRPLRRRMMEGEDRLHHHVSVYGADEYRRLFEAGGFEIEDVVPYAPPPLAGFCLAWTSAVKYESLFPLRLSHNGLLRRYLSLRYRYLASRERTIRKWHERFFPLCYRRCAPGEAGAGLVISARRRAERTV